MSCRQEGKRTRNRLLCYFERSLLLGCAESLSLASDFFFAGHGRVKQIDLVDFRIVFKFPRIFLFRANVRVITI